MEKKKVTLKEFIQENYQLLTVQGVFGALFTFFSNLNFDKLSPIQPYLLSIIFFIFILVAFEIWQSFPSSNKNEVSRSLNMFEQLYIYFTILVIIFGIHNFRDVLKPFLIVILLFIYGIIGIAINKKLGIPERIDKFAEKFKGFREKLIRSLYFLLFLLIIGFAAILTHKLIVVIFPSLQ